MGQIKDREIITKLLHKVWELEDKLWTVRMELQETKNELLRVYKS